MTRSQTLIRTLATTLAISALAAPAAGAKPVNVHAVPYAVTPVTAPARPPRPGPAGPGDLAGQDLRAPDQQVPAPRARTSARPMRRTSAGP